MSTKILWTDHTVNPGLFGCTPHSPGCTHCFAAPMAARLERMGLKRYAGTTSGGRWVGGVRVDYDAIAPAFAKLPKKKPARVFLTSMSDLFHKDVPFAFIADVFTEMANRPHLVFQILTKRAERMAEFSEWRCGIDHGWNDWPANVWAGVTVEDQRRADERIPLLLQCPAAVRWVSVEPMLGPINLRAVAPWDDFHTDSLDTPDQSFRVSWVVCGGESGPNARPMHPDWARSLRDQCKNADVPFLFKQWGEWGTPLVSTVDRDRPGAERRWVDGRLVRVHRWGEGGESFSHRLGKKAAGRLLDGRTWDEFPESD